ncbi:DUF4350 domain-containing protein [Streptomyces sp. NBC_00503]|uniref:DUF4350 domain-containing protein n=1 Tax=Streptomyces sp. NBC_00503 TaxID=2903659 RepID=UPI002E8120F0|nr:DUF4350 domain-containing protein [Streptomyces sp. NBC_00503]WUD81603.1 DUF4350 domain-containing protein [Streptomyces sp. NBC_00503]
MTRPQDPSVPPAAATTAWAGAPAVATDAAPAGAPAPAPATAAAPLTPGVLWTRARGFLIALALLLTAGLALAAMNSGARHGYLDPRSADPFGSRAVAELLKNHGVDTRVVTTADAAADAAGPDTTLLVTDPDRLEDSRLRAIRSAMDLSGGRTVLLAPSTLSLPALAPGTRAQPDGTGEETDLDPGCALPAATSAGRATTGGGYHYTTNTPKATACYPSDGHPTLLVLPSSTRGGDSVLIGSERIFLNNALAKEGNASLALQLLGTRPHLVWYMPSLADSDPDDAEAEGKSFLELIPAGWSWALLQLFLAAAVAGLWRARRLGPLVTERLPVLVPASEATQGRARLYHKAGARDRAATVLRAASRERLAALVGVPASQAHDPVSLVPAVSARLTDGSHDLHSLLFGTTPTNDAALIALADQLDALEREVRSS